MEITKIMEVAYDTYAPSEEDLIMKGDNSAKFIGYGKTHYESDRTKAEQRKMSFKADRKKKKAAAEGHLGQNYLSKNGSVHSWTFDKSGAYKKNNKKKERQEFKKIPAYEEDVA